MSTQGITNFASAIECDLYFKTQTNKYLSFIIRELMLHKSFEQGKLLNCVCDDEILMNFLNPYFEDTLTVNLLGETKSWFKTPTTKFAFSKRSLIMLKSFKTGYFDCIAIRLSDRQISTENFKNVIEVFKKITKHLIVIEDHRLTNKLTPSLMGEYSKTIASCFSCVSDTKTGKWHFKWYNNDFYKSDF
ncbi:hypothetical protein GTQ40_10880 [Flavobacteriaceae bacterium R38]|nr:hypothetical protein [Flavobacteriaceae bacterium R38]